RPGAGVKCVGDKKDRRNGSVFEPQQAQWSVVQASLSSRTHGSPSLFKFSRKSKRTRIALAGAIGLYDLIPGPREKRTGTEGDLWGDISRPKGPAWFMWLDPYRKAYLVDFRTVSIRVPPRARPAWTDSDPRGREQA